MPNQNKDQAEQLVAEVLAAACLAIEMMQAQRMIAMLYDIYCVVPLKHFALGTSQCTVKWECWSSSFRATG